MDNLEVTKGMLKSFELAIALPADGEFGSVGTVGRFGSLESSALEFVRSDKRTVHRVRGGVPHLR